MEKDRQAANSANEANMEIDRIFNEDDQQVGSLPKKASLLEAEDANMNIDRLFNEDHADDADLTSDPAFIARGNG